MAPDSFPDRGEPGSLWRMDAAQLLAEVIDWDDAYGCLANANGDELRDALRLAANRLRAIGWRPEDAAPPRLDPTIRSLS